MPQRVAAEISQRVDSLVLSKGSGAGRDGQFLFSCDILGTRGGHYPRHPKGYCTFCQGAIQAFTQYKDDLSSGTYPAAG